MMKRAILHGYIVRTPFMGMLDVNGLRLVAVKCVSSAPNLV